MALTLKQKEKLFRNKERVGRVVISHVKKKGLILFGQKAVNKQLPKDLRKDTEDYDIFSNTPRKTAKRIERKLDRKFKGDYFFVKEAMHKGTYKVNSHVGNKGIADVSKPDRKVPTVKRQGVRLASLEFQKQQIKKSLDDPESKFRHPKDKEVRSRIKIAEQRGKKRRKPTKGFSKNLRFKLNSFGVNPNTQL